MKCRILLLFFSLVSIPCFADNSTITFEPANLKNTDSSLQRSIKFPQSIKRSNVEDNVVIRCDALLTHSGKFERNFCYENGKKAYPYVTAINRAAKHARIKPGKVNGVSRKVWFQYYVVFMQKEGKNSIDVFPNSGLEVDKYGFDYTSAQRYENSKGKFGVGCGFNNDITINTIINSKGNATKVRVIGEKASEKCKKYLVKSFLEQKFIPAHHNGVAISSFYSQKIFDNYRPQ